MGHEPLVQGAADARISAWWLNRGQISIWTDEHEHRSARTPPEQSWLSRYAGGAMKSRPSPGPKYSRLQGGPSPPRPSLFTKPYQPMLRSATASPLDWSTSSTVPAPTEKSTRGEALRPTSSLHTIAAVRPSVCVNSPIVSRSNASPLTFATSPPGVRAYAMPRVAPLMCVERRRSSVGPSASSRELRALVVA